MLRYLTAGESHGKGYVIIVDGVPSGIKLDPSFINNELSRRMAGYGRGKRMRIEKDHVEIISGCRLSRTLGSPIGMLIYNKDARIDRMPDIRCPRPGHADLAGMMKFGFNDARNVLERASARETAARVAAGAVAKIILGEFGIRSLSHVTMIGRVRSPQQKLSFNRIMETAERSDLRCVDKKTAEKMRKEIDRAARSGDTLGGAFEVIVEGVPAGLGSYAQWDQRLDGALAKAVMSIQAVKALSIGSGIESAAVPGSEAHDAIYYDKAKKLFYRKTNRAGGLEGGMTNGEDITIKVFMKPIATLMSPLDSVDVRSKKQSHAATERADVTAVPSCGVVAEAAVSFEIASAFLAKFGGDSLGEVKSNYGQYVKRMKQI